MFYFSLRFCFHNTILQSKKNYERACREAEIATKAFNSAEMDAKSTKAQLDKVLYFKFFIYIAVLSYVLIQSDIVIY